jgi:heme exporter protein D
MSAIGGYLAMGGYAAFVWPAYAAAFAILGSLALFSWVRYRQAGRALARLQSDPARRRQ